MTAGIPCWLGCVDKVNLAIKADELPVLIEGVITDQDGPDTIKITKAYPVDGGFHTRVGIDSAIVTISDDAGNTDILTGISRGYYVTNSITGTIGRTYKLSGVLRDGTTFESTLEKMAPAGSIDSIFFELASRPNKSTGVQENVFNVFVNCTVDPSSSRRLRWKLNGTYKLVTNPALIQLPDPNCLDPVCPPIMLACVEGCQCCVCYATDYEQSPILSDTRTVGSTVINRTFIHAIPISNYTFYERYRMEVIQMEVSQPVYDFYFAIKRQTESGSSIFQPPFLELPGNVNVVLGSTKIIGIFSAAAQTKKHINIYRSDVPYALTAEEIAGDCRSAALRSTTTVPPFWN